jgi:hypothetical protein
MVLRKFVDASELLLKFHISTYMRTFPLILINFVVVVVVVNRYRSSNYHLWL